MDPLISLAISALLAVLLATAAVHKIADPAQFREALAGYGLLPAALVAPIGHIIPAVELAGALLILVDGTRVIGGLLAAGLFALYGAAMALNLLRGRRDLDCGCSWGIQRRGQPGRLHEGLVIRNLILVALALAVALIASARPAEWLDYLNGIMGGMTLVIIWIACDRLVANRRMMTARRAL